MKSSTHRKAATDNSAGLQAWPQSGRSGGPRWEQIDFKTATLHIRRAKNGTAATHPLSGREMRELRRRPRESAQSPFVFVSERGAPLGGHQGLRLQARQRWPRHARDPGVSGTSQQSSKHDGYSALAPQRSRNFFEIDEGCPSDHVHLGKTPMAKRLLLFLGVIVASV